MLCRANIKPVQPQPQNAQTRINITTRSPLSHALHQYSELTVYFQVGAVLQTAQQKPGSLTWMAAITSGWFR
jgi:hypothetical protein